MNCRLLVLELLFVFVLVRLKKVFSSKTVLLFTLTKQLLRVALHIVLLAENCLGDSESIPELDSFATL